MPNRVFTLSANSHLFDSRTVGCLPRRKLQSWVLLWLSLSFPVVSHPALAKNSAQDKPAKGASSFLQDKRAAAQQAFDLAQRLRSEGTAASLKSALEKYQQALGLWHELGDQRGEAITLNSIGLAYESLGEKQKALDYYNQALHIARAVGDRPGEATMLSNIGTVYSSLGEKQKALDYYNQALPLRRAVGDRSGKPQR